MTPSIRTTNKEILTSKYFDAGLKARHIYLRNPLLAAINVFRSKMFFEMRERHRFVDFSAPIITPSILYEPSSAIHISNLKESRPLYLSQCAGFYLEAGAHAHERVYNLGPSFRNESRTNRHLMEYWHIKAELCSGDMDDIISLVEVFIRDIAQAVKQTGEVVCALLESNYPAINIPFERITYREAVKLLQSHGQSIAFGANISKSREDKLTELFSGPVWITHKPRNLEPFPYCVDGSDSELTLTADLIAPGGFG